MSSSSFSGPNVFSDSTLDTVSSQSKADSSLNAQLTLASAVTLPVFGAKKGNRVASSDSSSVATSSIPPVRGRGRGASIFRGFGKRKADPKDANPKAPKMPKSPRRGNKSPRGRGFQK